MQWKWLTTEPFEGQGTGCLCSNLLPKRVEQRSAKIFLSWRRKLLTRLAQEIGRVTDESCFLCEIHAIMRRAMCPELSNSGTVSVCPCEAQSSAARPASGAILKASAKAGIRRESHLDPIARGWDIPPRSHRDFWDIPPRSRRSGGISHGIGVGSREVSPLNSGIESKMDFEQVILGDQRLNRKMSAPS